MRVVDITRGSAQEPTATKDPGKKEKKKKQPKNRLCTGFTVAAAWFFLHIHSYENMLIATMKGLPKSHLDASKD